MCGPDIPDPPNPTETASAQTGANVTTAIANTILGNANQNTPDYRLRYRQTGTQQVFDPNFSVDEKGRPVGGYRDIPQYTVTTRLKPRQQRLKDTGDRAKLNLATLARDQSARANELLSRPVEIGNEATEARLFELGSQRLDPRFEQERDRLSTRLANQGIGMGSEAYNREMERFSQTQNDAYNNLLLSGRAQAVQESLAERNQPINEITALLSGSQVSQPNFAGFNAGPVANTDVAGIINQEYQQRANAAQAQGNFTQSLLGGLFGAGASLGGAGIMKYSDRRLKRDIRRVGRADNGLPIYTYRYAGEWDDGQVHMGFMADEVATVNPDAVGIMPNGYLGVDYGRAV